MKTLSGSFSLILLLLLLSVAAWSLSPSAPESAWLLPGLAALALGFGLVFGDLPRRLWVGGAAILGLIALYAWNPTHRWSEGVGLLPVDHIEISVAQLEWLPGSAFPEGTWTTLGLASAMVAAYALAFGLSERQGSGLQIAAMLGAGAMALAVLAQRLEPKPFPVFARTGIFVNENHFAVFSNMILPVVLAMACRARFRAVQKSKLSSPAGLFLLVAILMATAVVLCRSRAGVAVMALEIIAMAWWGRTLLRRYPFAGRPGLSFVKVLGGLAIVAFPALAVAAFAREWGQIGDVAREGLFRVGILRDASAAWAAQPIWGTGPGTFAAVFPYYQSAAFQGQAILHAHCEPVQFLSEFGLAGSLWIALAVLSMLSAQGSLKVRSERIPAFAELERRAFAVGLFACALHSTIDFPLRVPLIALLAATWAGVWAGSRPIAAREEQLA